MKNASTNNSLFQDKNLLISENANYEENYKDN